MRNIVEVHWTGDSKGEAQHSGRISDQQVLVSHVVPLASYSRLFPMCIFDIYDGITRSNVDLCKYLNVFFFAVTIIFVQPYFVLCRAPTWPNWQRGWPQIYITWVQTPGGLCEKGAFVHKVQAKWAVQPPKVMKRIQR